MDVGRLQTLDLSNNLLQQLTQRSLAGLHANLEIIKLYNNRLATVDRCVFYRFNDIDLLNVGYLRITFSSTVVEEAGGIIFRGLKIPGKLDKCLEGPSNVQDPCDSLNLFNFFTRAI